MKIKFATKRKMLSIIAICIVLILALFICVPTMTAYAAYSGQSGSMTRDQLHNYTLETSVGDDTPAITVFMHGLGSRASTWSNNFSIAEEQKGREALDFVHDAASIIEKMRDTAPSGLQLYRAKTESIDSFMLYSEYGAGDQDKVSSITDFSKHTVIVMDIPDTYLPMEDVYENFHYVIDKISYDYYIEEGQLPRINLIGHSMGGLINMQYAIEHPKNVAALVSIGTPYNGSWYNNGFVEMIGIQEFEKQPCMTGDCLHDYYFCDLEQRRNAWNNVYENNPHLQLYALSGETSIDILDYIVLNSNCLSYYARFNEAEIFGIRLLYGVATVLPALLPGDICVDTESQKATGYDGVINYNKVFSRSNCDVYKRAQNDFPVPHNLEPYDADMHDCILRIIDYGNEYEDNVYSENGINVSIIAKSDDTWLVKLTNNTGSARSFEYNKMMCSHNDAENWTGLGHIATTDILANGASTIIAIQENGTASDITISYDKNNTRYIFYGDNLDPLSCTMISYPATKIQNKYIKYNMEVSILSKYGGKWTLKLTNKTGVKRSFEYNQNMCFDGDAQSWSGLTHIAITKELESGESTILEINEYGTATSIGISYTNGSTRYIFYANNLNTNGTMSSYSHSKAFYIYSQNGIKVSILGKYETTWFIRLTNNTGITRRFEFNRKMCFAGDAENWIGLTDVVSGLTLVSGESAVIKIEENGTATSIAISYISGNRRYIFYAYNLNVSGAMSSYSSDVSTHKYTENNITVSIAGKNGTTWLIDLTNNTGSTCSFFYNGKMCNTNDAKNWTGLTDIRKTSSIANGATVRIEISENASATDIAISYISGNKRKIFYAHNLDAKGTMTSDGFEKDYYSYTQNGMTVSIAGKNGSTWLIELTNNTGNGHDFDYNRKMCYEGDAQNWTNLSHVSSIYLGAGETTSYSLQISENMSATSIAISYKETDKIRKIFYAYNLNTNGTMSAFSSEYNEDNPPDECLVEGTLITLADGTQKAVEELTGTESLLVWNMETGEYDSAPIMFVDSEPIGHYEVIELTFSDGRTVGVVAEHGFWDVDLNEYVYLDENADDFIGHDFVVRDGAGRSVVTLTDVDISTEVTTVYSPVTYGHLCYFANGMLTMPGGIEGLFNIFEVDPDTLTIDEESYASDIAEYGLYTYEEFAETFPISEEVFEAFNGQYLKVSMGKGLITEARIGELIARYAEFF